MSNMIITDATNKINSIPESVLAQLGYTREGLLQKQQKENAAILMCGGLLGDCYLMAEIIDWIFNENGGNLYNKLKKQKWYKQEIKAHINKALKELKATITTCRDNSPTNSYYMMSVADSLYDIMKLELIKLQNSFLLAIGNKIKNPTVLSELLVVDLLAQWISDYYDRVIMHMKTEVFEDADYDSWYFNSRCSGVSYNIGKALECYSKKFMSSDIDIDFNDSVLIKAGLIAVDDIMNSPKVTEIVKADNAMLDQGEGENLYNKSLDILGIKRVPKALPKPKKQKPNPVAVPIEEQVAVEMTAKDILSQKFKVK